MPDEKTWFILMFGLQTLAIVSEQTETTKVWIALLAEHEVAHVKKIEAALFYIGISIKSCGKDILPLLSVSAVLLLFGRNDTIQRYISSLLKDNHIIQVLFPFSWLRLLVLVLS